MSGDHPSERQASFETALFLISTLPVLVSRIVRLVESYVQVRRKLLSRSCSGRPVPFSTACVASVLNRSTWCGQELELKVGMAADFMKTRDRTTLTAYLSAWTLQVFVDDEELKELEEQIETEKVLSAST